MCVYMSSACPSTCHLPSSLDPPTPYVSRQSALAFARLCQPPSLHSSTVRAAAIQRMLAAVSSAPTMVYGTDGFCTQLMTALRGRVVGKRGAAGVYFSGVLGSSIGCAVKIDDGTMGPQYNVTMHLLRYVLRRQLPLGSIVDADGDSDKEGVAVDGCEEEVEVAMKQLEKYFNTPSFNSMGRLVGHMSCSYDSDGRTIFPALCLPSSSS
jgi:hypothetical protein